MPEALQTCTTAAPAHKASLYFVCEYERNGHSDSDFLVVYWNDALGALEQSETGSTRYAAGPVGAAFVRSLINEFPPAVLDRLEQHISKSTLERLRTFEKTRHEEPQPADLSIGTDITLLPCRSRVKAPWQAGATGRVFWTGHYGTYYIGGYKTRDRSNGRVGVELQSGARLFVPMKAVRLSAKIDDERLKIAAERAALALDFRPLVSGFTWESRLNPELVRS